VETVPQTVSIRHACIHKKPRFQKLHGAIGGGGRPLRLPLDPPLGGVVGDVPRQTADSPRCDFLWPVHSTMPATVWMSATMAVRIWLIRQVLPSRVYSGVPTMYNDTLYQFASCCNTTVHKAASAAGPSWTDARRQYSPVVEFIVVCASIPFRR